MSEPFEPYTATKAEMKAEAVKRMKILGFDENIIKTFKEDDYYFMSELGILKKITEEAHEIAEAHAKEYGYVTFHVIHSFSNIGETYE